MKKNNVILYVLLAISSIFLLWLWYYLGFNKVDEPLDLVLTIIWWVMITVAIVTIVKVENDRKERVRTVYVSDKEIFNVEAGKIVIEEPSQLVDTVSEVVSDLTYGFSKEEFPEKGEFDPRFLIRTSKKKDDGWEGEVVNAWTNIKTPFKNRGELTQILGEQG